MKKLLFMLVVIFTTATIAQKKRQNGKLHDKHPKIEIVEEFTKAFVEGDDSKLRALVSKDFYLVANECYDAKAFKNRELTSTFKIFSK